MLEKEIKILDIEKEEIKNKLIWLWAKETFNWWIHDIYYDFPGDTIDWNKRIFRIRKKWEIHLYTIKRKRNKKSEWWEKWIKIADEHEMTITNVESFKKTLEKYWLKEIREKKKHRTSFSLDWIEFDIDKYDDIPCLLEIEANTNEEIKNWIKKLWLENNVWKTFWSRWLFDYYWKSYLYINDPSQIL